MGGRTEMGWIEDFFHPGPFKIEVNRQPYNYTPHSPERESLAVKSGDLNVWFEEINKRPYELLTALEVALICMDFYNLKEKQNEND